MSSGYVYLVELLDMGFESDREWPKTGFNSLTFGEFAFDGLDDALNVLFHLVTVFVLLIMLYSIPTMLLVIRFMEVDRKVNNSVVLRISFIITFLFSLKASRMSWR